MGSQSQTRLSDWTELNWTSFKPHNQGHNGGTFTVTEQVPQAVASRDYRVQEVYGQAGLNTDTWREGKGRRLHRREAGLWWSPSRVLSHSLGRSGADHALQRCTKRDKGSRTPAPWLAAGYGLPRKCWVLEWGQRASSRGYSAVSHQLQHSQQLENQHFSHGI